MIHHRRFTFKVIVTVVCLLLFSLDLAMAQTFTWTMKKREKKGSNWRFVYHYPELSGSGGLKGLQGIVKDFNSKMKSAVDNEEKTFTKELGSQQRSEGAPDIPDEHTVACTIIAKSPRYASFLFDHYEMIAGMAHPGNWYHTLNWTEKGDFLAINDLFKPGKEGLQRLSRESGRLLEKKFNKDKSYLDPEGWAPREENFKHFCISPEGLHIYFDFYQVGPRPIGGPNILIQWKSLNEVLSPSAKKLLGMPL